MTKFIVKGAVKYNDKVYASGSIVEVADKDVAEFKSYGWQIVEEKAKPQENKQLDLNKLKNAELEALLTEKGIEFEKGTKKADLIALLQGK